MQKSRKNFWGNLRESAASTCLLPAAEAALAGSVSCGSSGRQCEQWQPSIPRVTRAQSSVPHNQDAKCCPKGSRGAVRATFMPHSAFPLPIAFAYTVPSRRCARLCMQGVNICICNNNILMACPKCVRKSKRDLLLLLPVCLYECVSVCVCACFVSRYADANNNKGAGAQAWRITILATTTRGTTFGSIKSCWQHAVAMSCSSCCVSVHKCVCECVLGMCVWSLSCVCESY